MRVAPSPATGQLTREGTKSYVYDAWGELSEVKDGATVRQSLAWNADGTLARATLYDSGGTFVKTVAMAYDERGQRVGRKEPDSGGAATGPGKRWLRNWQNFTVHSDEIEELDGAGGVQADYMYGDGERGSRLLAATRAGAGAGGAAATAGVHADHLGSVGGLTGADGLGIAGGDVDYDPFGATLAAGASALDRRYTGQPLDADLGLQYHRYRWLNAGNGRFASPDPIFDFPNNFGLRYGYGGYSPAMKEDVSGLFSLTELEVTAYIQGLVTQVVVPNVTSYILRAVMSAASIDPMMIVRPLFQEMAEWTGLDVLIDGLYDELREIGGVCGAEIKQLIGFVQKISQFFVLLTVLTSALKLVTDVIKFMISKSLSNLMELVSQLADLAMAAFDASNEWDVEINPDLRSILSKHHGFMMPYRSMAQTRKLSLALIFEEWFKNAGLSIDGPENKLLTFNNQPHSWNLYKFVFFTGQRKLAGKGIGTSEYRSALLEAIEEIFDAIKQNPEILSRNWNGAVKLLPAP